jgi:hypothetical protein
MIIPYLELPALFSEGIYKLKIFPGSIAAYLEQPNNTTAIYLQGGNMFVLNMSIEEYEETIRIYFKEANKLGSTKLFKAN